MKRPDFFEELIEDVINICDPCYIYLVSHKINTAGEYTSAKLCVVVDDGIQPESEEKRLLIKTNTPIPIDFIVYNISDWNEYANEDNTFAYRVENGGERLYVKE